MRSLRISVAAMIVVLVSMPALAQNRHLSPEMQADTAALRALTTTSPLLPVDRIALQVHPALTLVRYSAVAGDKDGNLYVLHRPGDMNVDPIVVLDAKGEVIHSWGEGVSELLIGYPVWVSEQNRTTHVRASNDDDPSAALPLLRRDRYRPPWDNA
jgi:hypothetical protein